MKQIEKSFNKIKEGHNIWSSYLCFASLCQKVKMTPYQIRKWFNVLVEKEDYEKDEKRSIIEYLLYK